MADASKFEFLFLSQNDADEIVALRRLAHEANFKNRVNLAGLDWNYTDRGSVHLGLREKDSRNLAACLRLSFFTTRDRVDASTLVPLPETVTFPVALLSRAATRPSLETKGLHSLLRLRGLEACLQTETEVVLGSLEASAKRTPSLEVLGYEVLATQVDWGPESFLKPDGAVVLVGLLGRSRIANAAQRLQQKHKVEPLFPITMPFFVWI